MPTSGHVWDFEVSPESLTLEFGLELFAFGDLSPELLHVALELFAWVVIILECEPLQIALGPCRS